MAEPGENQSPRLLYVAVFVGGMSTLAIELSASRLLGNVFGTSNIVWANVIGLILLYLSIGYFIGGRWADRSPHYQTFYTIMIWGAFLSALIPLASRPVVQIAARSVADAEAALALGSFVSILVLFSVPVTLLGCVSPFAIRLAISQPETAGKVSGQIYALSTLGSLVGTFIPVLYLIPEVGTFRTFIIFSGMLFAVGFVGLWTLSPSQALRWIWMPIVIGILSIWALNGYLRPPEDGMEVLYETESGYNYIQVQESPNGYRYLYLNEGQGVHSIWHPDRYFFGGTWDLFLAAPYYNNLPYSPEDLERVLVVGLATGTIPRQYFHVYDEVQIDGIEIDPKIIHAGEQYFDMNAAMMPNLTAITGDGRYQLNQLDHQYSVIAIDAYRPPYIPWHLTTVEFFREVADRLIANGVVAINVGRTNTDRRLVDALAHTMSLVFPSVYAVDVPDSFNTIIYATKQHTSVENLAANEALIDPDHYPDLIYVLDTAINNHVEIGQSDILFTDDRAPIETLVDSLVINFLLNGDINEIR